jgi:hypothetical protein
MNGERYLIVVRYEVHTRPWGRREKALHSRNSYHEVTGSDLTNRPWRRGIKRETRRETERGRERSRDGRQEVNNADLKANWTGEGCRNARNQN